MSDQPKKPSDFSNLSESGRQCVGCSVTSDKQKLLRLDTYSVAMGCYQCYEKHKACGGCNHEPHSKGPCPQCGCPTYRHSLAAEFDRQFAACVGLEQRVKTCDGFGINLGKCGRIILIKPTGELPRLCDPCIKLWSQEAMQGMKEVTTLLDMKIEGEPN